MMNKIMHRLTEFPTMLCNFLIKLIAVGFKTFDVVGDLSFKVVTFSQIALSFGAFLC